MDGVLFNTMGKGVSVRQAGILGLGCGTILLSVLSLKQPMLIPLLLIPILLGVIRTKTMTADEYILSLLSYAINKGSTKRIKTNKTVSTAKRVPSNRLGLHPEDIKKVSSKAETIMKIPVIDKRKAVRLNVTILGHDGTAYANQFVSIFIDNIRIGAVSTDGTGKTAVTVVPGKIGTRALKVMPRNGDEPLLNGMVEFVNE